MNPLHPSPLVITPGEPAGIGPELIIQLSQAGFAFPLVIMASEALLAQRAEQIGIKVTLIPWDGKTFNSSPAGQLITQDCPLIAPCHAGQLDAANSAYVLHCLDQAIDGCLGGQFSGLITGPIHKGIINEAIDKVSNISRQTKDNVFSGHTEYLQKRCQVSKVVMMLASPRMKVALASTHLPLKEVAESITPESLTEIIGILITDLQGKFGIKRPRILVAGLNPHAGENGYMGREEIDVIQPVLARFKNNQVDLIGPLPADTLFNQKYLEKADAVLAMYHDQGLPVLKFDGFGESVNITLGLPIIRTSVDHGTALDLAGTGQAETGSLNCAIQMAIDMTSTKNSTDHLSGPLLDKSAFTSSSEQVN